jgi:hypothetical protein
MTRRYGRHTYEAEERIRHEALGQTARKASETLAMQHIHISASAIIRTLRLIGKVNPEVRTWRNRSIPTQFRTSESTHSVMKMTMEWP